MQDKSITLEDRIETLKLLLKHGATLDYETYKGDTLLHIFAFMLRKQQNFEVPDLCKQMLKILLKNMGL